MQCHYPIWSRLFVLVVLLGSSFLYADEAGRNVSSSSQAQKNIEFVNSLEMQFVKVDGLDVLFSVWETRVSDYQAFIQWTQRDWEKPEFDQQDSHPVVNVSWEDAMLFCRWLTAKEHDSGKIKAEQVYRLPTSEEWGHVIGEVVPEAEGQKL